MPQPKILSATTKTWSSQINKQILKMKLNVLFRKEMRHSQRKLDQLNPLQYSCPENSMDSGGWQATVHGVTESDMTERLTLSLSRTIVEVNFSPINH